MQIIFVAKLPANEHNTMIKFEILWIKISFNMHFICRIYWTLTTTIICNWPKGLKSLVGWNLVLYWGHHFLFIFTYDVYNVRLRCINNTHLAKRLIIRKESPLFWFWSRAGLKPFYLHQNNQSINNQLYYYLASTAIS